MVCLAGLSARKVPEALTLQNLNPPQLQHDLCGLVSFACHPLVLLKKRMIKSRWADHFSGGITMPYAIGTRPNTAIMPINQQIFLYAVWALYSGWIANSDARR